MGQEDYLIREMEKIGIVLRAILSQLMGNGENLAITLKKQFEETNEILLNEINFDLGKHRPMNYRDSEEYVSGFKRFDPGNLELLAEILFQLEFKTNAADKKIYLVKALQLYEHFDENDKTYPFDRENKIEKIKSSLQTG